MIWATSDSVPVEENGKFSFEYHGMNKGQRSLLLNSSNEFVVPTTPDVETWTVKSPEVCPYEIHRYLTLNE